MLSQLSLPELPFVDRKIELERFQHGLELTRAGHGGLLFVSGEVGIGKTRLASEFRKLAENMGFWCLWARCMDEAGRPILFPWIEFVRQFCRQASAELFFKTCGASSETMLRLVPELFESTRPASKDSLGNSETSGTSSGKTPEKIQREEREFNTALTDTFLRLSENSPLLLVLDDMQSCDFASVEVLNFLTQRDIGRTHLLIMCVLREQDSTTNSSASLIVQNLESLPHTSIRLSRLGQDEIVEIVERIYNPEKNENWKSLEKLLYSRTGGNPLFISETLRYLMERQVIFKDKTGTWVYPNITYDDQLPDSLRGVIEQRIGEMEPELVNVLRVASTAGKEFDLDVIKNLFQDFDEAFLRDLLKRGLKSSLIQEKQSDKSDKISFKFSDELIRDVLHGQLDSLDRKRSHSLMAEALEANYMRAGEDLAREHYSEIAFHYLKGGNLEKAHTYYVKAAKRASELYAHADSFAHYEKAMELLESISRGIEQKPELILEKADLLERMGEESFFLPQIDKTHESWKRAAELYEECGEKLKAAFLLVKRGVFYQLFMYDLEASNAALQKALKLAKEYENTSSAELARITAWATVPDIWSGNRKNVIRLSSVAMKLAEESGAHDVTSMVSSYGIGANLASEIEACIESCNRGLSIALANDLPLEACYNYFHRMMAWNYTYGPSKKSLELFLEGLNFTTDRENFRVNLFLKAELTYGEYLPLGEWVKAREMAEEAINSVQGFPPNSLFCLITESAMGQTLLHFGELDEAEGYLEHVRSVTKGYGLFQLNVPLFIALARLNSEKANFVLVEKYLKEGYRVSKQRGLTVLNAIPHVQILCLTIEFLLAKGLNHRERDNGEIGLSLEDVFEELEISTREINREWAFAYLHRAEGLIAADKRELDKAVLSLEKSVEIFEKLGWQYELARARYNLGYSYLAKARMLAAGKSFDLALKIFSRLGAKRDVEKIDSLKKQIKEQGVPVFEELPKLDARGAEVVLESLMTEYMHDFLFKKLATESCGWRTLSEIGRDLNLPTYALYGKKAGINGPIPRELVAKNLVETRTYSGERGRGGEVTKMRIALWKTKSKEKTDSRSR